MVSQRKTAGPRPTTWALGGLSFYKSTFTDSLAAPSLAIAAGQYGSIATDTRLEQRCRQLVIPWTVDKEPHVRTEKTGSTTETLPCYSVDRKHDSYLVNCHKPAGSARSDSENLNFRLPASAIMPCQPSPIIVLSHFRHVPLFATPWTVAHQAPLSIGFSREEYWSRLPCPSPGPQYLASAISFFPRVKRIGVHYIILVSFLMSEIFFPG